jgi:hypothetical protein
MEPGIRLVPGLIAGLFALVPTACAQQQVDARNPAGEVAEADADEGIPAPVWIALGAAAMVVLIVAAVDAAGPAIAFDGAAGG